MELEILNEILKDSVGAILLPYKKYPLGVRVPANSQ
jgi:hypothetical protein